MEIRHTEAFDLAYRFVTETNQNIFLTGKAGTGKTTFLRYLRENSIKNIVVAAPTGVAAVNAHGVTLHSLFQLPLGVILPEPLPMLENNETLKSHPLLSKIHYQKEKLNLLRSMELLVIDEASMLPSYIVDAIDSILRYIRRRPHQPFGGVQILFIGDLHQLPPVVKKEDRESLQNYYSSPFFFDSLVLLDNIPVIIELKEIFRQRDDKFIEILNGIRNNNITEENFRLLNSRLNRYFTPHDKDGYIVLTTHNYQSDEINKSKLNNLPTSAHIFHCEVNGEFPEHNFPAEKELRLKRGAQVMFVKNDTEGKQYFNGKIGTITYIDSEMIKVKCKDDSHEIEVNKCEWQNIRYKVNPDTKEISEEVLGTFTQYPLRLAWAITIHKSQGLTFDKVIIDAEKAFATGQVYVALSRCTSLEGLILKSPININFLGAHEELREWENKNSVKDLSQKFTEAREDFILQELENIFTWKEWYYALKELNDFLVENRIKIPNETIQWISGLMEKQKELYKTSEKFKETIRRLSKGSSLIEKNVALQQRIKEGANYFYNEINKWKEQFFNHNITVGTKKLAGEIDNSIEEISGTLDEILKKINYCKNGFVLNDYLKRRRHFPGTATQIKSTHTKSKVLKTDTVEETINLFREGKSIKQIAAQRDLVISTIENHVSQAIRKNLIQIEEVMPIDEAREISKYFPKDLSKVGLSEIKEKAPAKITYGKLRMVLAWLQSGKG